VNELDQMVEGGYHHRDVVLSSTATPRGGGNDMMIDENMEQQDDDDNNNNEDESISTKNNNRKKNKGKGKKSRQSTAVKGGQPSPRGTSVQTAMKKHRLNSLNETLIEESTFEDEEDDDTESIAAASRKTSQVAVPFTPTSSALPTPTTAAAVNAAVAAVTGGGVPVRRLSQQMTTAPPVFFPPTPHESVTTAVSSSAAPSRNASFSRAITKISFFGSLGAIAQAQKTVQNQFQPSNNNNQLPNSGSAEGLLPEHGSADLSEGGNSQPGKFFVRKLEEDANLTEKIMSNAAIRMKDSLVQQISDLENKLIQEKQQKEKEHDSYLIKEKGHQLRDCILSSEITRLNKEVSVFSFHFVLGSQQFLPLFFNEIDCDYHQCLSPTKVRFNGIQKSLSDCSKDD
jgi:hypothetical protein